MVKWELKAEYRAGLYFMGSPRCRITGFDILEWVVFLRIINQLMESGATISL